MNYVMLLVFSLGSLFISESYGESESTARIYGGDWALPHQFPWMAHLTIIFESNNKTCGGSLISNQWVLTAAHCVRLINVGDGSISEASKVILRLGKHDLLISKEVGEQSRSSSEIHVHPNFTHATMNFDFALVKMESPVPITRNISTIALPGVEFCLNSFYDENSQVVDGCDTATACGWGVTENGITAKKLKKINLPIRKFHQCTQDFGTQFSASTLCAGGEAGSDTCKGDSGGPLFCRRAVVETLLGLTSKGSTDCGEERPAIYSRVCGAILWIRSFVAEKSYNCRESALPKIPNGIIEPLGGVFSGALRKIICNDGYTIGEGNDFVLCSPTGNWILAPNAQCIHTDEVKCSDDGLPVILNGIVQKRGGNRVGDSRNIICNVGYSLQPESTVICTDDGSWTVEPDDQRCQRQGCDRAVLPVILNGFIDDGNSSAGDGRNISCNEGYTLTGPAKKIYCLSTGTWSQPVGTQCIFPGCSEVSIGTVLNGTIQKSVSINAIEATREITCDAGFSLVGEGSVRCLLNGSWSAPNVQCRINCTKPTVPCSSYTQCITRKMFCDRDINCDDGSDELDCPSDSEKENLQIQLAEYALSGNVTEVERLLGPDFYFLDVDWRGPRELEEYNENNTDSTALQRAVACNRTKVVLLLVEAGANVNLRDVDDDSTPLIAAVSLNNTEVMRILIEAGADVDAQSSVDYSTALGVASGKCNAEACELLLDKGAYVEVRDYSGYTPLMLAMTCEDLTTPKLLLQRGANFDAGSFVNGLSWRPLFIAIANRNSPAVRLLLSYYAHPHANLGSGITPLMFAAKNCEVESARALVGNILNDLTIQDDNGWTALHWAVFPDHKCDANALQMIYLLLDKFGLIIINQRDNNGSTPLSIACASNNTAIFELLLTRKADFRLIPYDGVSLLLRAIQNDNLRIVERLIIAGANVEGLPWAVHGRNRAIVDFLLAQPTIDINETALSGMTALHYAVSNSDITIARLLLSKNISVNLRMTDGTTALAMAISRNFTDMIQLLKQKGATT